MIKSKIKTDLIFALKQKNNLQTNILRYILSKFQNLEIEKKQPLTEEEEINVLRKVKKELEETLSAGKKANRPDLIKQTEEEIKIITTYLPPTLSPQDLKNEIIKIIKNNQDLYQKNPKAIIGICIKALKSKAEPSLIIKILNSLNKTE